MKTLYILKKHQLYQRQIGVSQRVAMIDMEAEGLLQLINPKIKTESNEKIIDLEGSVNLPNVFGE